MNRFTLHFSICTYTEGVVNLVGKELTFQQQENRLFIPLGQYSTEGLINVILTDLDLSKEIKVVMTIRGVKVISIIDLGSVFGKEKKYLSARNMIQSVIIQMHRQCLHDLRKLGEEVITPEVCDMIWSKVD